MLVCYDKVFPEAARALASTAPRSSPRWPPGPYAGSPRRLARGATARSPLQPPRPGPRLENQVVWVSANQTGRFGRLRFPGQAKVVDPDGRVLASTGVHTGAAVARLDARRRRGAGARRGCPTSVTGRPPASVRCRWTAPTDLLPYLPERGDSRPRPCTASLRSPASGRGGAGCSTGSRTAGPTTRGRALDDAWLGPPAPVDRRRRRRAPAVRTTATSGSSATARSTTTRRSARRSRPRRSSPLGQRGRAAPARRARPGGARRARGHVRVPRRRAGRALPRRARPGRDQAAVLGARPGHDRSVFASEIAAFAPDWRRTSRRSRRAATGRRRRASCASRRRARRRGLAARSRGRATRRSRRRRARDARSAPSSAR